MTEEIKCPNTHNYRINYVLSDVLCCSSLLDGYLSGNKIYTKKGNSKADIWRGQGFLVSSS